VTRAGSPVDFVIAIWLVVWLATAPVVPARAADDVMQRSRAMYAELRSYADTGTVINEYGVSGTDRHTFTTVFRRTPRGFVLDFRKQAGDRFVIWGDPDAFHTWWKTTGVQSDYPNPNNTGALTSGANTAGTVSKIPTLIYAKAALVGDFTHLRDLTVDGSETIAGHRCDRLIGTARDVYGTGREVNLHKMTIWIDGESLLIRKILEEWVPLPGQRSRVITTYDPQANPAIDDSRLRFSPPRPG
jgi:hypothetical protein